MLQEEIKRRFGTKGLIGATVIGGVCSFFIINFTYIAENYLPIQGADNRDKTNPNTYKKSLPRTDKAKSDNTSPKIENNITIIVNGQNDELNEKINDEITVIKPTQQNELKETPANQKMVKRDVVAMPKVVSEPKVVENKISVYRDEEFPLCGYSKFTAEASSQIAVLRNPSRRLPSKTEIPLRGWESKFQAGESVEIFPKCWVTINPSEIVENQYIISERRIKK